MEIFVYDEITAVMARQVAGALRAKPREAVTLRVNSYGGDLAAGLAMLNALRAHHGAVSVEIEGVAASAATLFCCVGTVRMADNAALMIHAPWSEGAGTARDHRNEAEGLERMGEAMIAAYAARTGKPADQFRRMLDQGDTWFTAREALAIGLIDEITPALRVAARLGHLKLPKRFLLMPESTTPPTTPDNVVEIQNAAAQAALVRDQARRREIRGLLVGSYAKREDLREVMDACLDDPNCDRHMASQRLLRKLGEGCEPLGGPGAINDGPRVTLAGPLAREFRAADRIGNPVAFGGYGEHQFRAAASDALAIRLGAPLKDAHPAATDFRETSFTGFAAMCLSANGHHTLGKSRASIIKAAMTTSDFPELLSTTANKTLGTRLEAITTEHRQLCDKGDLTDFKPAKAINVSALPGLVRKHEAGEIVYGAITDGAETYQLATYARGLILSREALINDDLDGFGALLRTAANTAGRLERDLVFAVLTANAALSDGVALFHADHGNLDTSSAGIAIAGLNAARVLMRKQQDSNGGYVLTDPRFIVCPVVEEGDAEAVVAALTYRPASNVELDVPKWVKSLVVVSDPRLDAVDAADWYLLSHPAAAPVIKLGYLNGQTTPEVDNEVDFDRDVMKFKIRFDVACAAVGWAGAVKMA
jgi:ATP-dependent protease ClpP protease subunit